MRRTRPPHPLSAFCATAGQRLVLDLFVLLFVGRVQPLKGPDVVLKVAARLLETDPDLRGTLQVVIVGGPSGRQARDDRLLRRLVPALQRAR